MSTLEQIQVTSSDGVGSNIRLIDAGQNSQAVLICLPAMGVKAEHYDVFAKALSTKGFSIVIGELRGNGSSSIRASRLYDFGYHDLVSKDVPAIYRKTVELFPDKAVYFCGHSLGGQLSALFLSQNPGAAKGLILCASCTVYHRGWDFPHNLSILLSSQLFAVMSSLVGYFPGHKLGFGGREARTLIHNWARNARTGRYELSGSLVNYEDCMQNISLPVLAINFSDDRFAPLKATKNLLSKFGSTTNTITEIDASMIGCKSADHFSWIKNPDIVAHTIKNWIASV